MCYGRSINTCRYCISNRSRSEHAKRMVHSDGEPYSIRRLAGSLIIAVFAALALAQIQIVDGLTDAGIVLVGLTIGFTADYVVTKAKKEAE